MNSAVINGAFPMNATLTPSELANILDLAAKAPIAVGITLQHIAPVFQRAAQLASLPAGTRIGAVPEEPQPPATAAAQLELPLELPPKRRRGRPRKVVSAPDLAADHMREYGFGA